MPERINLSGKTWWEANQARYPNSNRLEDLEPGFQDRVRRFIKLLRDSGATVRISSTLRHPNRAYLMHYSWKLSHGSIRPADVPKRSGVLIEWDHGDDDISREAATDMVKLFHMAHIASLTSNHTRGTAIDMTINWKDPFVLRLPMSKVWEIRSSPPTGDNPELHQIGAQYFQVYKLVSDPPHWSHNGK